MPSACSAFAQTWFANCSICSLCASARHRRCCHRWRTAAPRCSSSFIWPSSARGRVDPPCGTHRCATIPSFSTGGPSPSLVLHESSRHRVWRFCLLRVDLPPASAASLFPHVFWVGACHRRLRSGDRLLLTPPPRGGATDSLPGASHRRRRLQLHVLACPAWTR